MLINILFYIIILYEINGFSLSKDILLKQNKPEENPDLFEGDMRFPVLTQARGVLRRGDSVAWTNGIVPYEIQEGYNSTQRSFIISIMQKMERLIALDNVVCIQFRPRISTDRYYITIRNGYGCSSYVGQNTDVNMERIVTLQYPGCFLEGIIMHELLHTLGFYHEQSRPDRDGYIKVNYQNIITGLEYNFEKYNTSYVDTLNISYDYSSVMHYPSNGFSSNGFPTIEPLQSNVSIGQRDNMSLIDIEEVRLFYNCSSDGSTFPTIPTYESTLFTTTTDNLHTLNRTISSSLKSTSCLYARYNTSISNYYYESFQINVLIDGYYKFTSNSSIDTYGYLYLRNFYSFYPSFNLIIYDDDAGRNQQFQFEVYLQSNITYVLVLTTFGTFVTGDYQLLINGLNPVDVRKLYNICHTTTRTPWITTTTSYKMTSMYSSSLTRDTSTFTRYLASGTYYYEAIVIYVTTSGPYQFQSYSSVDSYGYLYVDYFDPSNARDNLLDYDDNSAEDQQFLIRYNLQSYRNYILVTTTYSPYKIASFSIVATGPSRVTFSYTSTTTRYRSTPTNTHYRVQYNLIFVWSMVFYIFSSFI